MPRPRTEIKVPNPTGTEFENFDRLVGILAKAKPIKQNKSVMKRKKRAKAKA